MRRLTPEVLTSHPIWMVYRREVRIAQPVREVINFVVEVIRANGEKIRGKQSAEPIRSIPKH